VVAPELRAAVVVGDVGMQEFAAGTERGIEALRGLENESVVLLRPGLWPDKQDWPAGPSAGASAIVLSTVAESHHRLIPFWPLWPLARRRASGSRFPGHSVIIFVIFDV
jgi:hypothetical protein